MNELVDFNRNRFFETDEDIKRALDWFLAFIGPAAWEKRKLAIEKKISFEFYNPMFKGKGMENMVRLTDNEDKIGWYLYLAEKLLTDPPQYEVIQGARVVPIFKRIGADLELLKEINGVTKKARYLVKQGRASADAILFEMLIALLWTKNGWKVSMLPEKPPVKSPDLLAERNGKKYYIECKRLNKTSDYSERERAKWLKMITYINDILIKYNVLLDVKFHIELDDLPDDFLETKLSIKIPLASQPMHLISNDTWDVHIDFVNYEQVNEHLEKWDVKYPSPQLYYLIAGKKIDTAGFTCGMLTRFKHRGTGTGNGQYVDAIDKAYGVSWSCDAEDSLAAKARDIKKHLAEACSQFPDNEEAVIHIGLETVDGGEVEDERMNKIIKTVNLFDSRDKKIKWIYCHFFQSYAPPEETWVFDETVSKFADYAELPVEPIKNYFAVLPPDVEGEDDVHWHKASP